MTSTPPERVRITGPPRRRTAQQDALPRTREIDEETRLGEIYMGSLLREQARLAGGILVALFATVGALPLVFHLWPGLAGVRPFDIPVPWLLLGFLVYPYLFVLGWIYVHAAERNERDFAHVVEAEAADEP